MQGSFAAPWSCRLKQGVDERSKSEESTNRDARWAEMQRLGLHSDELDNGKRKGPRDMTMENDVLEKQKETAQLPTLPITR